MIIGPNLDRVNRPVGYKKFKKSLNTELLMTSSNFFLMLNSLNKVGSLKVQPGLGIL